MRELIVGRFGKDQELSEKLNDARRWARGFDIVVKTQELAKAFLQDWRQESSPAAAAA